MITLTRSRVRQIRAVFSRCLNVSTRGPLPTVTLCAGGGGLSLRAKSHDAAIEFHQSGEFPEEQFAIPFGVLKRCEGSKPDDIALEQRKDTVVVQWNDGGIPQIVQVGAESQHEEFPAIPSEMRANDIRLVSALRDAVETTDNDATRYALNCVQLQGKAGKIAATDGRQLLIQSGFDFSWDDDVLVPARKVFASREILNDQTVEIGKADDWVCFHIGSWTIHLKIEKESRFPRVEDHVPGAGNAKTRLWLSDADADFLAKAVKRLPSNSDCNSPITVDLNGAVAIRAQGEDQSAPTELVLCNSSQSGEAVRFNTNRSFLARAMKLGFRDVHLYGPESPAFCCDETRQYLWALLDKDGAIKPHEQATRIESPGNASSPSIPQPRTRKAPVTMPTAQEKNGAAKRNGRTTAETNGTNSLIEQAESVRVSLQESLSRTRELIGALKRQKKQSRLVQSTLASLRQLQTVDV